MSVNSTTSRPARPSKPNRNFPMFAHPSGQWAKKIKGRCVYFGSWRTDPTGEAALKTFEREWPYLREGKIPPSIDVSDGLTMKELVNDFLATKEDKLNAGELSPRSFRDYYKTCDLLIEHFKRERLVGDIKPADFRPLRAKLAGRLGKVRLRNEINRCCSVFNHAFDNDLIEKPVKYGSNFDRPSAEALQDERNQADAVRAKLFTRDEVLKILAAADVQLRAMVHLALNCGFGNNDIARLPESAVNLETGWVNFPRPKTKVPRKIPLWPETVAAIRTWLPERPKAKSDEAKGRLFVTRNGRPWVRMQTKQAVSSEADSGEDSEQTERKKNVKVPIDALSQAFRKLLAELKINGRRGLGFYIFRHCCETHGGECKDQVAVDAVMGHKDSSMAANYRHGISDERLRAVVETVRAWLFAPESPEEKGGHA